MSDELVTRLRQQALLAEVGRRALANLEFDQLLTEAARLCAIGLNVRFCKILEYLPVENRLFIRAGTGWHEGVVGVRTVGADLASPAGYALHTGKAVISNHLTEEDRFRTPELFLEHGIRRAVNVILGDGKSWGVLEVDSETPGTFSEHDVDFLQAMANMLGLALERHHSSTALQALNETLEHRVQQELAERRQAEDALRQSQKMETVGHLTGGVAHDFNNLLQIITGNLERALQHAGDDHRLKGFLTNAHNAAERGAQLTGQLLTFARRHPLASSIGSINDFIHEFEVLTARMLGDAIEVDLQMDLAAGQCEIDSTQFGSALLNLFVNARDAMPDGGRLVVRSGNAMFDDRSAAALPDAKAGEYVFVAVTDTGCGMEPDVLRRATEPLFTTKAPGKGTGLGLSQVYGFARQSFGFLTIESQENVGSTVTIYLPRIVADATQPRSSHEPATGGGMATILVVEDDPGVRELVSDQLQDLGYAVLAASTGHEALSLLKAANARPVDLLITDLMMPGGMTGLELVREARADLPRLRAILTSGHGPARNENEIADVPLLAKPYRAEDLARAVQTALASG